VSGDRQPEQGFLRAGGTRLEYNRIPPSSSGTTGPTVVMLHEGLGCARLWKRFPVRLADATGLGVFAWSRAGFGRSDPVALPRPLDYLEREEPMVAEVLAAAGIGRAVLVGHSDGGTIALLHAGSHSASGIVGVVAMAAHVFVEDVTIEGIIETKRAWEDGGLRARLSRWHGENVDCAFHGWCDTWLDPRFRCWNIEERLGRVRIPVLAMQGGGDEYGTAAQVDAIVRGVGGPVEGVMLPNAGHAPHVDAPDAVIQAIRGLLQRIGDSPGR
jgi:pimeloyl-ACP methyl ester carboxylesterase